MTHNANSRTTPIDRGMEIAPGVLWVGSPDETSAFSCNPFVIREGQEAVLIDGGSQPDFATVMMKILQSGVRPTTITALIFQHYDPDLCGAVAHFEDIIDNPKLRVISHPDNERFIRSYSFRSPFVGLSTLGHVFRFKTGRTLRFYDTPYAHTCGSFVTFDEQTGTLFSSDLCGGYTPRKRLYLKLYPQCQACIPQEICPHHGHICPIQDILAFHRMLMPSQRVLRYALEILAKIPFRLLAPQHGHVIRHLSDVALIFERLVALDKVGVDRLLRQRPYTQIGDIDALLGRIDDHESQ